MASLPRALAASALLLATASCENPSPSFSPSFISNTDFRTTRDGSVVGAQDGNMLNVRLSDGSFALVGMLYGNCPFDSCKNQSQGACGFSAGQIGVWTSPTLAQNSWTLVSDDILPASMRPSGIYFRPHIIFNAATDKYVLWVRWLNVTGPSLSDDATLYLTAVADQLAGPWTVVNTVVPMFYTNSADDNLFVDDDGTAYIAHTCRNCSTHIVVERLTPDYTACEGATDPNARSALVGPGGTEAPSLFLINGTYYLSFAPLCCYCTQGSPTMVYTASSPLGPYTLLSELGNAPGAQQNFVFAHPDLSAPLWAGNRWGSDPSPPNGVPQFDRSLQYWYPLSFAPNGTILPIAWLDNFTLGVAPPGSFER
jgi:hypothetical protein